MARHSRSTRWSTRAGTALLLAATLVVWLGARGTVSGFAKAIVSNPSDAAKSAVLSVTHTITSPSSTCTGSSTSATVVQCSSTTLPASVTTGTSTVTDTITNSGTVTAANVKSQYRVASCGAVQLANVGKTATNGSMLVRNGTTFSPTSGPMTTSGSITLNGSSYASSVAATSEPNSTVLGAQLGLGIWFKTTDKGTDPLFGFGTDPTATIGTNNDRILYLSGGKIGFVAKGGTTPIALAPAAATGVSSPNYYADGTWHFAYVAITIGLLTLGNAFTLYVDGKQVSTASGLLNSLASYSGYWHLGWSPISGTGAYFTGSLSGFLVDDTASAPTSAPATNPTSYTTFDPNASQSWHMDDSGGTFDGTTTTGTYTGTTFPVGGDPCKTVDMTWAVGSTAIGTNGATLAARTGTYAPASPGLALSATQTATLALTRDTSTYNAYDSGLLLYAPIQATYTVYSGSTATQWTVSFVWARGTGTSTVVIT